MTAYQHTDADANEAGYLPFDGQGQPISRADFDRIVSTALAHSDPEDHRDPSRVSLDHERNA